jgi:hypothetical protein
MWNRLRAPAMLRAVRESVARLNRALMETGSSDEDLVFHIRKSEAEGQPQPFPWRAGATSGRPPERSSDESKN